MPDNLENIWSRYMRAWGLITLAILVVLSLFLTFTGELLHLKGGSGTYLQAIGGSLLASVVFYALVSVFLEPKIRALEAIRVSNFAIQVANDQFRSRFQVSLPDAVYGDSDLPRTQFSKAFTALLKESSRYDFKGASAVFTAFRLDSLKRNPEVQRLEEVRLSLADPRDAAMMRAHAKVMWAEQMDDLKTVDEFAEQLKIDIAVSLMSLFDIRNERPSIVYLHRDLPLFRCEMFDSGMFLSYYSFNPGRSAYPEALQYSPLTRPYQAYRQGLELTRNCASCMLWFTGEGASADIINTNEALRVWLERLNLNTDLDELRMHRQNRFDKLNGRLAKEGLSTGSVF